MNNIINILFPKHIRVKHVHNKMYFFSLHTSYY